MPTYQYLCAKCGEQFEVQQSFSDDPLKRHKGCGGTLSKVFGVPAISLKGSGFYKTDNPSSSRSGAAKTEKAGATDAKSTDSSGSGSTGAKGSGTSEKPAAPAKPAPKATGA
ncbi:MAG: FmdB family zinc ribbon protein [Actinomycetes bacterium]